jgi:alpha-ketoglutaric semialdehyde dehydrogenase
MFTDSTPEEIDELLIKAWNAFHAYRKLPLKQRADFMRAIGREMELLGDDLLAVANQETHLPEARLRNERTRTIFQLNSYADACERGDWLEARIDTAEAKRNPPKPDIRKMLVPIGPVAVFGAANFPFAYSTAGGDTASALAAGCPVVVKAHPAHADTSEMVAQAIMKAATLTYMPAGIFTHLHGFSFEVGKAIVQHRYIKAVGFTGSFSGGKQLFDWAAQRKDPIPVFAEMSSVNPVFLLPGHLLEHAEASAKILSSSITLGVGQFCTNPGLIIAIANDNLDHFSRVLAEEIKQSAPAEMLNPGIFKNYVERRANALAQADVETVSVAEFSPHFNEAVPTIATTSAANFINNPLLHQEVFGPYSIIIRCKDLAEMAEVAMHLEGQLTATIIGTDEDIRNSENLIETVKDICGRFVLNGVPTGVEVCLSMQHGGPFPATTDARFTSVGADAIKRFARPLAFQNWKDEFLPEELKDQNPLGISRTVNDKLIPGRTA